MALAQVADVYVLGDIRTVRQSRPPSSAIWEFVLSPAQFIETYVEPPEEKPLELPAIHRDLALHMGHSADLNRRQFRWLTAAFRTGAILLVAEVVAWVVALANQS